MNYETKARPIRTESDLNRAIAAGARLEFTRRGEGNTVWLHKPDRYDDGPSHGGWVRTSAVNARWHLQNPCPGVLIRAFYPRRPSLLSRLAFWRTAA